MTNSEEEIPDNVTAVRVIRTKGRTYFIDRKQQGVPLPEHWPNTRIPEDMKEAMVYRTHDGPVIVRNYDDED